jgi:hypothetical protein
MSRWNNTKLCVHEPDYHVDAEIDAIECEKCRGKLVWKKLAKRSLLWTPRFVLLHKIHFYKNKWDDAPSENLYAAVCFSLVHDAYWTSYFAGLGDQITIWITTRTQKALRTWSSSCARPSFCSEGDMDDLICTRTVFCHLLCFRMSSLNRVWIIAGVRVFVLISLSSSNPQMFYHKVSYADQALKPTVLIGTSGKGGTFTKEVLEEISSYQDVSSFCRFDFMSCRSIRNRDMDVSL